MTYQEIGLLEMVKRQKMLEWVDLPNHGQLLEKKKKIYLVWRLKNG